MLMFQGEIKNILDPKWFVLELRSERTAGPTLRRIGKLICTSFEESPVEVFAPISIREHEDFEMRSDCYIFIRSDAYDKVKALRRVIGVASLLMDEISHLPIKVDDAFVREMIQDAEEKFNNSRLSINTGSFVRVLDGDSRDYCGEILNINNGRADVKIVLKGRTLLLNTPVGNLASLDHIPTPLRVYFYCGLVQEYYEEFGDHAVKVLEEDLRVQDPPVSVPVPPLLTPKRHRSRHETATALIRRLVAEGERDLIKLADQSLDAIFSDRIKKPKTAHILYSIIKKNIVEAEQEAGKAVKNFRDVLKNNPHVEFSLDWISERARSKGVIFNGNTESTDDIGDDEGD